MLQSTKSSLSVVFPNLNGDKGELSTLLKSIFKNQYHKDKLEVIMVDNGSTNNSRTFVAKNFPQVKIIRLAKNYGFAKAVNIGISKSKGEFILVTNNDVKFKKDCLENLVSLMSRDPKIGIAGCKVYDMGNPPHVVNRALTYSLYTGRFKSGKESKKPKIAEWVAGCAIAFPKRVWKKLHGYDEDFFFSSEELDLCLRAKKAGFKVIYNPNAVVWHGGSTTVTRPQYFDFGIKHRYRGKIRLILKHCNPLQVISSLFCQYLFAIYKSQVLKEKSIRPIIEATIWNLGQLPKR